MKAAAHRVQVQNDVIYLQPEHGRPIVAATLERDLYDNWLVQDAHGVIVAGPFPARARALDQGRRYAEELRP